MRYTGLKGGRKERRGGGGGESEREAGGWAREKGGVTALFLVPGPPPRSTHLVLLFLVPFPSCVVFPIFPRLDFFPAQSVLPLFTPINQKKGFSRFLFHFPLSLAPSLALHFLRFLFFHSARRGLGPSHRKGPTSGGGPQCRCSRFADAAVATDDAAAAALPPPPSPFPFSWSLLSPAPPLAAAAATALSAS